jgi:hypothetical protein
MQKQEALELFAATDELGRDLGKLIVVIDRIEDEDDRAMLRRSFAEICGLIEERLVYDICRRYPELSRLK